MPSFVAHRQAFEGFLADQPWTWAVTANFNRHTTPTAGRAALKAFHGRIDRAFLGRNWQRAPADQRSLAIWQPEHVRSNLHYHGLIRVPPVGEKQFLTLGPAAWRKLVSSGSLDISPVTSSSGWGHYITKEQDLSAYLLSTEFHA